MNWRSGKPLKPHVGRPRRISRWRVLSAAADRPGEWQRAFGVLYALSKCSACCTFLKMNTNTNSNLVTCHLTKFIKPHAERRKSMCRDLRKYAFLRAATMANVIDTAIPLNICIFVQGRAFIGRETRQRLEPLSRQMCVPKLADFIQPISVHTLAENG